ncbi:MAG: HEAT repeat domain-containing protein, partial [Cyclobacteriaceae bacterium]
EGMKKQLIERINSGNASEADVRHAEKLIENGELDPMEIPAYSTLQARIMEIPEPEPSREMSVGFYKMLEKESARQKRKSWDWSGMISFSRFGQVAFGLLLMAAGFWIGTEYNRGRSTEELQNLTGEMLEMKEIMMLSLLDQQSTSQRLKAVNIVNELPDASNKVCDALLKTLRNDDNTNVRRAALEALIPYTDKPAVRQGLIEAIPDQDSPMMMLAISEVMVAIQEKAAVEELQKMLDDQDTPEEIKTKLKNNINTLI